MTQPAAPSPPQVTIAPASPQDGKTANELVIDHADRLWNSAVENANRIASRVQLIAGGVIGILTVGLFSFTWLYDIPSHAMVNPCLVIVLHILILLAVFFFVRALAVLYLKGSNSPGFAADEMEFRSEDAKRPARNVIANRTYNAYFELKKRNTAEKDRLQKAEGVFSIGLVLMLIAGIVFLLGSLPAKMYPEENSHDSYGGNTPAADTHSSVQK